MKYLITESQYNLLLEQISGLDGLIDKISQTYKEIGESDKKQEYIDMIEKFISDSGVKNILVEEIKMSFGLSLSDKVVINTKAFSLTLPKLMYVIFHEIAHQYQFKKYGAEKMYDCYTGEINVAEGAELMKYIEEVADDFALRKIRQLVKMGFPINPSELSGIKPMYKSVPLYHFVSLVEDIRGMIKSKNITTPEKISEFFYNWVKVNL